MSRPFVAFYMCLVLALTPILAITQPVPKSQELPRLTTYTSTFAIRQPKIDGIISTDEWTGAQQLEFYNGKLFILNDTTSLYVLIDLDSDTHQDNPPLNPPDYFYLFFDINRDGLMTQNVDIKYALFPGTQNLCVQKYFGPGWTWLGCNTPKSAGHAGFGATPLSSTPHRFWELALGLPELGVSLGGELRLGLNVYSPNPVFNEWFPSGSQTSFAGLVSISLAARDFDLLILSDEVFLEELIPLLEHKEYTGLATYLQSWQLIDLVYQDLGRDSPERIKKSLATYEQANHIEYVMVVGDVDRFPVRFFMTDHPKASNFYRSFIPTDLYYADLYEGATTVFESWDADNNGYFGEQYGGFVGGLLNHDQVDLMPDVSVGRVPASTDTEVTTYVNKVIRYELNSYKAAWAKTALLSAVNANDLGNLCGKKETILANSLTPYGYSALKLYEGTATYGCIATNPVNAANINSYLGQGAGFFNFMGHGNELSFGPYGDVHVAAAGNQDKPTVTFASSCGTGKFTYLPPSDPYTDIYGAHHNGTLAGETFSALPPPPDPVQPATDNPRCMAEAMTVEHDQGAVGYLGCAGASQNNWGDVMDELFFEALEYGADTLGAMRDHMIVRYYATYAFPIQVDPLNWQIVVGFHQPWKFNFFGDPSLRIHGVSPFVQKADFVGNYAAYHDGWTATMELQSAPDAYLDSLPNIIGEYIDGNGSHDLRGTVRTWRFPIPESEGPDWKIRFFVDFPNTPSQADDQKFEAYIFTHDKSDMAGITWWNSIPFGFYARKNPTDATGLLRVELPPGKDGLDRIDIIKSDFLGDYLMSHDGFNGWLHLIALPDNTSGDPNIGGTYKNTLGQVRQVLGFVRTPSNPLPPEWGPDHRIQFFVDFNNTPANPGDDQEFEGYLFTHNSNAMAGITHWNNDPYGFYAIKAIRFYFPIIFRN